MSIKLISNNLDGKYAAPLRHPITCLNQAPWKITEMKIEQVSGIINFIIWIRGEESCWFRVDQCFISTLDEVQYFLQDRE